MTLRAPLLFLSLASAALLACSGPIDSTTSDDALTGSGSPPLVEPPRSGEAALVREDLPAGPFKDRAEELATEWLDNNIMTGDPRLSAGVLRGDVTTHTLATFTSKLVADRLAVGKMTLQNEKIEAPALTEALLEEVAKVAAVDGFVFTPSEENIEPIEENVRELMTFLGVAAKAEASAAAISVAKVSGETIHLTTNATRAVTCWVFVNRQTQQFVAFYVREGST
jgi:hypothetical protein